MITKDDLIALFRKKCIPNNIHENYRGEYSLRFNILSNDKEWQQLYVDSDIFGLSGYKIYFFDTYLDKVIASYKIDKELYREFLSMMKNIKKQDLDSKKKARAEAFELAVKLIIV